MNKTTALLFGSISLFALPANAASSDLSAVQKASLQAWLAQNPTFRLATEADCDCADDIQRMQKSGPAGVPIPDYDPDLLVGDFRHNGQSDFAVIVMDSTVKPDRTNTDDGSTVLIFDGRFLKPKLPVLVDRIGLAKGRGFLQKKDDGHLLIGELYGDASVYIPKGRSYKRE